MIQTGFGWHQDNYNSTLDQISSLSTTQINCTLQLDDHQIQKLTPRDTVTEQQKISVFVSDQLFPNSQKSAA